LNNLKISSSLFASYSVISLVLIILNTLGVVTSGIWLAFLGKWFPFMIGILVAVLLSFIVPYVLMPTVLFSELAINFFNKKKIFFEKTFRFLNASYISGILLIWCLFIFRRYSKSADHHHLLLMLIWSYGVAIGPWLFDAKKDRNRNGNEYSMMTLFFSEISYVIAMIMFLCKISYGNIILTFGTIMLINVILQTFIRFKKNI
jgi:hypothetical protein